MADELGLSELSLKKVSKPDDLTFLAHRCRESLKQKYSSMHHTVFQKMMGLVYLMKRMQQLGNNITAEKVAKAYLDCWHGIPAR